MKYYSEKLDKMFDDATELVEAEKAYDEAHKAELKAKEEKKLDAKKVENAYKEYLDICKEASKMVDEAEKNWLSEKNLFVQKYGSYHMTYTNDNGQEAVSVYDFFDSMFELLKQ